MTCLRPIAWVYLTCAALLCTWSLPAQEAGNLSEFNPSDVYMQAWLLVRDGELAEKADDPLQAFNKYQKATRLFDSVAFYYPDWKPDLVKDRRQLTSKSLETIRPKAEAARVEEQKKTEILLEGPGQFSDEPASSMQELTPAERQQVKALQERIQALDNQLKRAENDRDANAARLRRTRDELTRQRDMMARAPMQNELLDLNSNISKLQQERDAMAAALRKSRLEQQNTLAELARLQTDTQLAQEKSAELQKSLITERNVSAQVVRGLRQQLSEANAKVKDLGQQLADAKLRNQTLTEELDEARQEISELRIERDSLIKERDHMAALLKMNESERVKVLIEENMKLGKELNQAKDSLQALFDDNNATKDQVNKAKRDLALAKARIIHLNKANQEQHERLEDLEQRLRDEGKALSSGSVGGSSEEVKLLKGIIARQLRVQDRRQQAKELVMEAFNRHQLRDPELGAALDIMNDHELQLTKEEENLISDQKIDGEFVFNDFVSPEERANNNRQLQRSIKVQTNAGHRAFANGRYMASREVFESILLEHPGHVPTKVKLGIVHMRLHDHVLAIGEFSEAIAIRGPFAYASFMLGAVYYEQRDFSESRRHFQESLELDPENAKAHVYLGVIAGDERQINAAERHFNKAIDVDPTLPDPYYNLARIYHQQGAKTKALEFYQKSIVNGGDPDIPFEKKLGTIPVGLKQYER